MDWCDHDTIMYNKHLISAVLTMDGNNINLLYGAYGQRSYDVVQTLWTSYRRWNNVVCVKGTFKVEIEVHSAILDENLQTWDCTYRQSTGKRNFWNCSQTFK